MLQLKIIFRINSISNFIEYLSNEIPTTAIIRFTLHLFQIHTLFANKSTALLFSVFSDAYYIKQKQ